MIAAAWVVFLGLLTLFFGEWLETQHNPNREVQGQKSQKDGPGRGNHADAPPFRGVCWFSERLIHVMECTQCSA